MTSWLTFNKYYKKTDDTSVYAAIIILHSSWQTQYIQQNWKKEWQKHAFSSVKKLWKKYQKADIADLAAVTSYASREIESLAHKLDEFDLGWPPGPGWDQIFVGWDGTGRDLHRMGRGRDPGLSRPACYQRALPML